MKEVRTGIGVDIHAFSKGSSVRIGGASIACGFQLEGHSDGDVLIHAVIDSILGASGLGDIGLHFPSSNDEYKGIDSSVLLERTLKMSRDEGWRPVYFDATIVAQTPNMASHILKMKENISAVIQIEKDRVNIKSTTTDHLGFIGREEGIACIVVVTMENL